MSTVTLSTDAVLMFREGKLPVIALAYDKTAQDIAITREMTVDGRRLFSSHCHMFGSRGDAERFLDEHIEVQSKGIKHYFPAYNNQKADLYGIAIFVISQTKPDEIMYVRHEGHDLPSQ